jgi:hypothetical protein
VFLSTFAGGVEGWFVAGGAQALLYAGLFAPLGAAVGFLSILCFSAVVNSLPKSPGIQRDQFQTVSNDALIFCSRSLGLGICLLFFLWGGYHSALACLSGFHHMGLAGILLLGILSLMGFLLLVLLPHFTRGIKLVLLRLPRRFCQKLPLPSLLFVPVVLLILVLISPVDGSGGWGFMGLLKRDDLELAFWAIPLIPALGAAYLFAVAAKMSRRALSRLLPVALFLAGIGFGAFILVANGYVQFAGKGSLGIALDAIWK